MTNMTPNDEHIPMSRTQGLLAVDMLRYYHEGMKIYIKVEEKISFIFRLNEVIVERANGYHLMLKHAPLRCKELQAFMNESIGFIFERNNKRIELLHKPFLALERAWHVIEAIEEEHYKRHLFSVDDVYTAYMELRFMRKKAAEINSHLSRPSWLWP